MGCPFTIGWGIITCFGKTAKLWTKTAIPFLLIFFNSNIESLAENGFSAFLIGVGQGVAAKQILDNGIPLSQRIAVQGNNYLFVFLDGGITLGLH